MKRVWHWKFDKQDRHCVHIQRRLLAQVPLFFLIYLYGGMEKLEAADLGSNSVTQAEAAQTYRDFVANPPWLEKIKFSLDRNYQVDMTDERHPQRDEGIGTYEAALQPDGYYRKHLKGSPLYDNPPGMVPRSQTVETGHETVSGASDRYYWRLWDGQNNVSLVPKDGKDGASTDNWLRGFFDYELADLEKIRRLGLDHLTDARITWADANHFTAVSPAQGSAHGTIVRYTNGLPETVEYSFDSASSLVFRVHYAYAPSREFPPHQITVEDTDSTGNNISHVNYIEELKTGLDPHATSGYSPESFRLQKEPFTQVSISSNGVLYRVDQHGQLDEVDTHYAALKLPSQIKPHPLTAAIVLIAPSLAFLTYFFATVIRRTKQNKTQRKT